MSFAIELYLDERADHRIRQIWAALDEQGVRSLGSIPDSAYHPHVTLSVFEYGDTAQVADVLRPLLGDSVGLPLPLEPVGFFLTPEAPVFLGVVPSSRFLSLHRTVHQAIQPLVRGLWTHYQPNALLPHCTLAVEVTDKATVVEVVSRFPMPIPALAAGAHLVEIPGGHSRAQLTST